MARRAAEELAEPKPTVREAMQMSEFADATVDGKTVRVTAGDIVIVPTRAWHSFVNAGTGRLRQVDIHDSSHFITDWLQ